MQHSSLSWKTKWQDYVLLSGLSDKDEEFQSAMMRYTFSAETRNMYDSLIITRESLGPTRWTGSHKQAARGPGDALSDSLASPYQIVFMASSIVQTMDWRD